jgi:soluble lytic murein transglycosylase-like protein
MDKAMAQVAKGPSYFRPDPTHVRKIAGLFGRDILLASLGTEISPAFLLAIITVESGGKIDAISSAGAQGLMQLIPDTAARFGVKDVNDPVQNIKGGATYLAWLLEKFSNDPLLALAGYNAGENAVSGNGGIPPYPETRAYVPKVVAAWQVARTFCQSPPRYIWEGCAFTVPHTPKPEKTAKAEQ